MRTQSTFLPDGEAAVFLPPSTLMPYDPNLYDGMTLSSYLYRFETGSLTGVALPWDFIRAIARSVGIDQKGFIERYAYPTVEHALKDMAQRYGKDRILDAHPDDSNSAPVPGALVTREQVQAELDRLCARFDVPMPVFVRFVATHDELPGNSGADSAFGIKGLPFADTPHSAQIVFVDDFLAYPKAYRTHLLRREFARCLPHTRSWPEAICGGSEEAADLFASACEEVGIDHRETAAFYPAGSWRVACRSCGNENLVSERDLSAQGMPSVRSLVAQYRCHRCLGQLETHRIDTAMLRIGAIVYEVEGDDIAPIGMFR